MSTRFLFSTSCLVGLLAMLPSHTSRAFSTVQRCDHEWGWIGELSPRHVEGRHAWAVKCGVYPRENLDFIWHKLGQMASFTRAGIGNDDVAPVDPQAPCDADGTWKFLTTCPLGCFTEAQSILFGSQPLTIPEAMARGERYVATLDPLSTPLLMKISLETEIDTITHGQERRDLVHIHLEGGPVVMVTQHHPMILAGGEVCPARDLRPGTYLATLVGPRAVAALASRPPVGEVYNLRPKSESLHANIIFADGVLSGSLRLQNEWADKVRRIWAMKHIDGEDVASLASFFVPDP